MIFENRKRKVTGRKASGSSSRSVNIGGGNMVSINDLFGDYFIFRADGWSGFYRFSCLKKFGGNGLRVIIVFVLVLDNMVVIM